MEMIIELVVLAPLEAPLVHVQPQMKLVALRATGQTDRPLQTSCGKTYPAPHLFQ